MARKPSYESLKKTWYAKLKNSGFNDIENGRGELKHYASSEFFHEHHKFDQVSDQTKKELRDLRVEAISSYYRMVGSFLETHTFKNSLEKNIWEQHSYGLSQMAISLTLSNSRRKITFSKVKHTIIQLRKIMMGEL